MDLYLIRHTSVDVPAGYSYGQTDVPLRETFEAEAATVKEELNKIAADKVYTSPLSRCVRLATYCGFEDAWKDDRIKELNFGSWEMKSWDEVKATTPIRKRGLKIGYMCPPREANLLKTNTTVLLHFWTKSVLVTIIPSLFLHTEEYWPVHRYMPEFTK